MFGLFKTNPLTKLHKQHDKLLEDAMHAQRKGDIRLYAELTAKADKLYQEINILKITKA